MYPWAWKHLSNENNKWNICGWEKGEKTIDIIRVEQRMQHNILTAKIRRDTEKAEWGSSVYFIIAAAAV